MRLSILVACLTLVPIDALAFEPGMDITVDGDLNPVIHGVTNLPSGAELIVSVRRPQSKYFGQDKVTVRDGKFKTERFGSTKGALEAGEYSIEVSMAMASVEPQQVQQVIGDKGQNMSGKWVEKNKMFGSIFTYKTQIHLGGAPNPIADAAAREQAKKDLHAWQINACAEAIDIPNAMVRAGTATGRQIVGTERQKHIDACVADAESHDKD